MHAELEVSESSHASSSSQSGKNVSINNEGVHEHCACLIASWQRTAPWLFVLPCLFQAVTWCAAPCTLQMVDRKQKQCKEAARKLYGVEPQYCQVTGRSWQQPEVVSCSHIISRGW